MELRFVGSPSDNFTQALKRHMELHEGVCLPDLVKFLHQSSLGSFHLLEMTTETRLQSWIERSLTSTKPSNGLLVENLYGRKWVRLNFGAYKKRYDNDYLRIYRAFMKVKNVKHGQMEEFKKLLRNLTEAFREGNILSVDSEPELVRLVEDFIEEYEKRGFPIIHHSQTYMRKNGSDYLVVPRSSLSEITGHSKNRKWRYIHREPIGAK